MSSLPGFGLNLKLIFLQQTDAPKNSAPISLPGDGEMGNEFVWQRANILASRV
jgi:hypothetical protein